MEVSVNASKWAANSNFIYTEYIIVYVCVYIYYIYVCVCVCVCV